MGRTGTPRMSALFFRSSYYLAESAVESLEGIELQENDHNVMTTSDADKTRASDALSHHEC